MPIDLNVLRTATEAAVKADLLVAWPDAFQSARDRMATAIADAAVECGDAANSVFPSGSGAAGLVQYSNGSGGFSSDTRFLWNAAAGRLEVSDPVSTGTKWLAQFLQPLLGDGNYAQVLLGKGTTTHSCGTISFVPDATAPLSTLRLGLYGSSDTLAITGGGFVGVGTSTPQANLHVLTEATTSPRGMLSEQFDLGTSAAQLNFRKRRGTGTVADGDGVAHIFFSPYDGASYLYTAGIRAIVKGAVSAGSVPTDIVFYSEPAGGVTERLRIKSTGYVGIGTDAPDRILEIRGAGAVDAASDSQVKITDTAAYNASPVSGLSFGVKYNSSDAVAYGCSVQGYKWNATDGDFGQALRFTTQPHGNSPFTRMTIDPNGYVGINMLAGYRLDVSGNIRADNEIICSTITGYGQFRAIGGNYGSFIRNDGANTYFLITNSGDQYGMWNGLRPFSFENATGNISLSGGIAYFTNQGMFLYQTTTPAAIANRGGIYTKADGNLYHLSAGSVESNLTKPTTYINAYSGGSYTAPTTSYYAISGIPLPLTVEAATQIRMRGPGRIGNLRVYVQTNTCTGACAVNIRKNGVTQAIGVSIGAGSTGQFLNSGSVTFADGDLVNYGISGGTSGTLSVRVIQCDVW